MQIFRLWGADDFEWLLAASLDDNDSLVDVAGTIAGPSWTPPRFRFLDVDDDGRALAHAECPWLGSHVLPFSVFNALTTVDVLDESRSGIAYGRRTGKIVNIEEYAFRDGVLPRRAAFRIPQQPLGTFFTEDLADDLLALDLAGLRLDPVGTAEPAYTPCP